MTDQPTPIPFVPISRHLIDGSLWEADLRVRVLWVTMLMVASEPARRGNVDMTVRALAARAAMSPEDVRFALDVLLSPDPLSRTPNMDGRRIQPISPSREWGWRIVNWDEYEAARERMLHAARQARYKGRQRPSPADGVVTVGDGVVTPADLEVEVEDEVEVEVEDERESTGAVAPVPPPPAPAKPKRFTRPTLIEWETYCRKTWPDWEPSDISGAWSYYEARGWKSITNWQAAARTCASRREGAKPSKQAQRALIGAHAPSEPKGRDLDDAPDDIKDIGRRIARREDVTDEESDRYGRWLAGEAA